MAAKTKDEFQLLDNLPANVLAQTFNLLPASHKLSVIAKVNKHLRRTVYSPPAWNNVKTFGIACMKSSELSQTTSKVVFKIPRQDGSYDHLRSRQYCKILQLCNQLNCIRMRETDCPSHHCLPDDLHKLILQKTTDLIKNHRPLHLDMTFSAQNDMSNGPRFDSFYHPLAKIVTEANKATTNKICKLSVLELDMYCALHPQSAVDYITQLMSNPLVNELRIRHDITLPNHDHPQLGKSNLIKLLCDQQVSKFNWWMLDTSTVTTEQAIAVINQLRPNCIECLHIDIDEYSPNLSFLECMELIFSRVRRELTNVKNFEIVDKDDEPGPPEHPHNLETLSRLLDLCTHSLPNLQKIDLDTWRCDPDAQEHNGVYNEMLEKCWACASLHARKFEIMLHVTRSKDSDGVPILATCLEPFRVTHVLEVNDSMATEISDDGCCLKVSYKKAQLNFEFKALQQ